MKSLSLAVVGADYPNKRGPTRRFEIALCVPGEPIELRPEPKNPADEHAVAVYSCRGVQLGYLTAERAPWIGGMLRNGRRITAVFQGASGFGAWIRIAFDGELPTLPPEPASTSADRSHPSAAGADHDPGFWPDDIAPDD